MYNQYNRERIEDLIRKLEITNARFAERQKATPISPHSSKPGHAAPTLVRVYRDTREGGSE